MRLTTEQKSEIRDYIVTVPRYRETYDELYDHILSSLAEIDTDFDVNLVNEIVIADFGGFSNIILEEKNRLVQLNKKIPGLFRKSVGDILKQPANIGLILLCYVLFQESGTNPLLIKNLTRASIIMAMATGAFSLLAIFKNRLQYTKYSILDEALFRISFSGFSLFNVVYFLLIKDGGLFNLSSKISFGLTIVLFSLMSIYVRSFVKFYNNEIKVLAIK